MLGKNDYQDNIVRQLNDHTGLGLKWEDFTLSNPQFLDGPKMTIQIDPTSSGEDIFEGSARFTIDRMDLSNKKYVYEWVGGTAVYGTDLYFHDVSSDSMEDLLALVRAASGVNFEVGDFEVTSFSTNAKADVTLQLEARADSIYYYGKLQITLTHPAVNIIIVTCKPTTTLTLTEANTLGGTCLLDGVVIKPGATIPAGEHEFIIRSFAYGGDGVAWVSPVTLNLIRAYNSEYSGLLKGATTLTSVDAECIQTGGGAALPSLFQDCTGLKSMPSVLFNPGSKMTNMNRFFQGSGLVSVADTLFKNLEITGGNLDYVFAYCKQLTTIPSGLFDPIAPNITKTTGLFEGAGLTSIPGDTLSKFTTLVEINQLCKSCTSLKTLSSELLTYGVNYKTLVGCFQDCTALSGIPTKFMDSLINMTVCNQMFMGCTSLKSVVATLVAQCTKLETFEDFLNRSGVTAIPEGFLDKQVGLVSVAGLVDTALSLKTVPESLFNKCTRLKNASRIMQGCTALTKFPDKLLYTNANLAYVNQSFKGLVLEFEVPTDFLPTKLLEEANGIFQDCINLTKIPQGLFRGDRIRDLSFALANTAIVEVPNNLVKASATHEFRLTSMFEGCSKLTTLANKEGEYCIYYNQTSAAGGQTYIDRMFAECRALSNLNKGMRISANFASLEGFMLNCRALEYTVSDLLTAIGISMRSAETTKVNIDRMFEGCWPLEGKAYDLYRGITGIDPYTENRKPNNFVEQDFLLVEYEDLDDFWWTTPISLRRADGAALGVYSLGDAVVPPGHSSIPLFSSYYMNLASNYLYMFDRYFKYGESYATVELTEQVRLNIDPIFISIGIIPPTGVSTMYLYKWYRKNTSTKVPNSMRNDIMAVVWVRFDAGIDIDSNTYIGDVAVDHYVLTSTENPFT